jgi:hypothetical protein
MTADIVYFVPALDPEGRPIMVEYQSGGRRYVREDDYVEARMREMKATHDAAILRVEKDCLNALCKTLTWGPSAEPEPIGNWLWPWALGVGIGLVIVGIIAVALR